MSLRARAVGLAAFSVIVLTALVIPLSAAAANTVNTTIQNPADLRVNPCTPGDWINFQSTLHIVLHATTTRNGYSVGAQNNWVASGRSIVTEVAYRGAQTTEKSAHVGAGETVTWIDTVSLVSQAATEDLLMHATYHVTVNAAGVPSAFVDSVRLECKG